MADDIVSVCDQLDKRQRESVDEDNDEQPPSKNQALAVVTTTTPNRQQQQPLPPSIDDLDSLFTPSPLPHSDTSAPRQRNNANSDGGGGGVFVGFSFTSITSNGGAASSSAASSSSAPPINVADDEQAEKDEEGAIPTLPPESEEIEERLGPHCQDDNWCYLHDGVNLYDTSNLAEETKKIRDDISAGALTYKDLVALAKQIQEDYNRTIWEPEQAAAKAAKRPPSTNLRHWTLRSIYNHIRRGDTSKHTLVMNAVRDLSDLANEIRNHGLYVRTPFSQTKKVSRPKCGMFLKVMQRLGQMAKLSLDIEAEQARQIKAKGGSGTSGSIVGGGAAHAGSSFTSISAINVSSGVNPNGATSRVVKPFPKVWK